MQTLIEFNDFVNELNKDNSRNYKISVLSKYKDNENIKYYLNFIYNPYITSGISDKKLFKNIEEAKINNFKTIFELLDYIKKNNTGTDKTISKINAFKIASTWTDSSLIDLLDRIIIRDLPLGVNIKTINKAIPNLIPEFSVQLANKYFDDPSKIEGKSFSITEKIDGNRIIAMKNNGQVTFYTRAGQLYTGLIDLEAELKSIDEDNFVLDGELVADISGFSGDQFKETIKRVRTKENEKHGIIMKVFDYLPVDEFKSQKSTHIYTERRQVLDKLFGDHQFKYFRLLSVLYSGNDTKKILELLDKMTNGGSEGIMLNANDATYQFKRSNDLLKCKKFKDCELEVIGFEEGTNSNVGKLGAILCKYKDKYTVKVGSGFDDTDRIEIWNNKDKYLHKLVTVKYFEESKNDNGEESLRFPIFIAFRDETDL